MSKPYDKFLFFKKHNLKIGDTLISNEDHNLFVVPYYGFSDSYALLKISKGQKIIVHRFNHREPRKGFLVDTGYRICFVPFSSIFNDLYEKVG